jgi:cytochrome c553
MSHFLKKMSVLAILLLTAGPIRADNLPVRNCAWCHGGLGQGYSKAPRLAGQRAPYMANQLHAFSTHQRDENLGVKYMWYATANLDPKTASKLAAYFANFPPEAAKDGASDLVAEGRAIFENGVPYANIAACQACHGPAAQGVRTIPRLGGLSYSYVKRRLEDWAQGFDNSGAPMAKVAASLSAKQVDAIASFLSFVEYKSTQD